MVQYFVVPEPQNRIALGIEKSSPLRVRGIFCVLPAIQFDNECCLATDEISNIGPYWHLAYELLSAQSPIAQNIPEPVLGI